MLKIKVKDELSIYDLEGKWNDFIGVQKEIIAVFKRNGNRFQTLPRKMKYRIIMTKEMKHLHILQMKFH